MNEKNQKVQKAVEHAVDIDQGSSLLPMLIAGLVMITIGMALVIALA